MTVFAISAGGTSLLTSLHYPPPEAGVVLAVGAFGFLACALLAVRFAERLERKLWLPIGATITVVGSVLVAEAGTSSLIAFIGMGIVFFGFNLWVPMTYALSAESFPTRARTTGFGLVDGFGHLGGGIGVLLIAPQIPHLSVLGAFLVIAGFLVVAAVIAQFALNMRDRRLRSSRPEAQPSHVLGQQLALPPASRSICLMGAPARVRRFTEDVVRASATATLS